MCNFVAKLNDRFLVDLTNNQIEELVNVLKKSLRQDVNNNSSFPSSQNSLPFGNSLV